MASRSWFDGDLLVRVLAALACLVVAFSLRWDSSLDHFDFQVWRAAETIVDRGGDPYDSSVLNLELHENPQTYGDHWTVDGWETRRRMHLFNPPSWLLELRLLGATALTMSLVGAVLTYGSIVALSRRQPTRQVLGHLGAATYVFVFAQSATTFRFGQTGFLLSGLVGVGLVLAERRSEGVAAAGLSFKPHIAAAALIPALATVDHKQRTELVVPTVVLLAATALLYPVGLWRSWIDALFDGDKPVGSDDMSFRTLSTRFDLAPSLSTFTLALALAASVAMAMRWRRADPRLLRLASLAVVIYLSGHAFGHDWLWIVFIPVVGRWTLLPSLGAGMGAALVYTIGDSLTDDGPVLVNLKSVLGLAVTVFLVLQAWRSHRHAEAAASQRPEPAGALTS